MKSRLFLQVLWPAFMAACVLEMLVFALVDPHELHWFGLPVTISRSGVYSCAFLAFWLVTAGSSWLSLMLVVSQERRGVDDLT
jgi:hypothetical protein